MSAGAAIRRSISPDAPLPVEAPILPPAEQREGFIPERANFKTESLEMEGVEILVPMGYQS
jgi:hypothetical protein